MEHQKTARLGRGLAALIGEATPIDAPRVTDSGGIKRLAVDFIIANRANPRHDFNAEQLEELTRSIREKGVMQPLLVRPSGDDPNIFELIAGERRWRAAQRAGLHEVPVVIREVDDREALELAIIENVQRADLNAVEEAAGYEQLMQQFNYTQNDLAEIIGKSRSHVANTLRLLKLPEDVRELLISGQLTAGHARTLMTADNPSALARRIVAEGLSVRQAEMLQQERAESEGRSSTRSPRIAPSKDADTLALEKRLSDTLGLDVNIVHGDKGGKLEIRYKTLEQLDDVCARLN